MKKLVFISMIVWLANCAESDISQGGETGQGGSLARFAIVGDYLYTVDPDQITTFDISTPASPVIAGITQLNWGQGAETVFPFNGRLFLGTETGMLIFDLSFPESPVQVGSFSHLRSCDPVVTNGTYAFVTLRASEMRCFNGTNQLDVIDVTDVSNPQLVKTYPMSGPKGLGLNGNELYVCDAGLKVYDISNVQNLILKAQHSIPANDVIVHPDKIIVIADDGIHQYVSTPEGLISLSTIDFSLE